MNRRSLTTALIALAPLALPAVLRGQDFVPGTRVLFSEDFTMRADSVLRRFRNVSPRIGVRAREGRPFLHARTPSSFEVVLPERLPQRYTVEFDSFIPGVNHVAVTTLGAGGAESGTVICGPHELNGMSGQGDDRVVSLDEMESMVGLEERVNRCAISVDGDRVRVWVNGTLAADWEGLAMGRSDRLRVHFAGVEDPTLLDQNVPVWLTSLRIAAADGR